MGIKITSRFSLSNTYSPKHKLSNFLWKVGILHEKIINSLIKIIKVAEGSFTVSTYSVSQWGANAGAAGGLAGREWGAVLHTAECSAFSYHQYHPHPHFQFLSKNTGTASIQRDEDTQHTCMHTHPLRCMLLVWIRCRRSYTCMHHQRQKEKGSVGNGTNGANSYLLHVDPASHTQRFHKNKQVRMQIQLSHLQRTNLSVLLTGLFASVSFLWLKDEGTERENLKTWSTAFPPLLICAAKPGSSMLSICQQQASFPQPDLSLLLKYCSWVLTVSLKSRLWGRSQREKDLLEGEMEKNRSFKQSPHLIILHKYYSNWPSQETLWG